MTHSQLQKFIAYLIDNHATFAPQEGSDGRIFINELTDVKKAILDERPPFYSWKKFFVPEKECLFEYQGVDLKIPPTPLLEKGGVVLIGLNILDLKSVLLYDQVFAADPYYQERRKNLLVIAHNLVSGSENNLSNRRYDRNTLKNFSFDILLELPTSGEKKNDDHHSELVSGSKKLDSRLRGNDKKNGLRVFTGSVKGKEVLEKFGYKDSKRIEFETPLREDAPDSVLNIFRDKIKNHHNPKIWEELGKICLNCGKCTIVCPTCFCFRIDDQPEIEENSGARNRCWDSCFYDEFSEVTGGHKFLNTTAERIHFWYFHKFVRIPDELGVTGCVGCHRCHAVCPVGIDIKKVLEQIANS